MTCLKNIPLRQHFRKRNTWLRKTIKFPSIFRTMTTVRGRAVNGNFSNHYLWHCSKAIAIPLFPDTFYLQYQIKYQKCCLCKPVFPLIFTHMTSITISKSSFHYLFITTPLLSKSFWNRSAKKSLAKTKRPHCIWY